VIPASAADITAGWLADALGLPVATIETEPIGVGVGLLGELVRVTLTYDEPVDGAPASVVVKLPTTAAANKALAMAFQFYEREVRFFRDVAPTAKLRVPKAWHTDMDVPSERFVLVLEDLCDYELADQVAGMTVDQARRAVAEIAPFHSQWWETESLDALEWMPTSDHPITMQSATVMRDSWDTFVSKWEHVVPPGGLEVGAAVRDAFESMLVELARPPRTIVHTDFRLDNLFFGPDEVAVIDWQLTTRGGGAYDIAYLLAQSMSADLRRAHGLDVLRHWYDALSVDGYSWQQAQDDYAAGILICLVIPVSAGADIDLGNERGEALVRALAERAFGAALDVDWRAVLDRI
jgi:aminoglycoside/choline kinase family phosphotransferase